VSSTVKDLVAGSDLRFEPRGEQKLKGVPEPWYVYALATSEPQPVDGGVREVEPGVPFPPL
jgi:hypothetical protein